MRLEHARWPELPALSDRIFVVPLGSLEQHGRHLPMFTDSLIIGHIADRVEQLYSDQIVMLPVQWLGHSPSHRRFGCVSLDMMPYVEMIRGVCRSLVSIGARRIFLMNGHGGNDIPCKAAIRELKTEFEDRKDVYIAYAAYWNLAANEFQQIRESPPGGMGHACEMETSIILSRHPEQVAVDQIAPGGPSEETGYMTIDMLQGDPHFVMAEFDELSENGVLGMPQLATAEKGELFLEAASQAVVKFLGKFAEWDFQSRARK